MARALFRSIISLFLPKNFTLRSMSTNKGGVPKVFSPPVNRSMRELDRSFFKKTIPISTLTVFDPRHVHKVKTVLDRSHESLHLRGVLPVLADEPNIKGKRILLMPHVASDDSKTWSTQLNDLVVSGVGEVRPYELELNYDHWTMAEILDAILPELPEDEKETPTGFAAIGHVAHLNLRGSYLPYKYFIGQVLADKNPTIKTVINKTLDVGTESEFRTFPYEVLAGPDDLNVTTSHQGCILEFDFSKVYFNTRLQTEHLRLVSKFKPGEAVCDVMAGVGPFALPAGKKKVFVRANDLNPEAFKALEHGIRRNKVSGFVTASCLDGRLFIKNETKALQSHQRIVQETPPAPKHRSKKPPAPQPPQPPITHWEPPTFDHFVMNLPAIAVEFLDAFQSLYQGREQEFTPHTDRKLPMIHVHTFQARRDTPRQEAEEVCANVSRHLGAEVRLDDKELEVEIFDVRLVAPKKSMYCASFRLPGEVAFARGKDTGVADTLTEG